MVKILGRAISKRINMKTLYVNGYRIKLTISHRYANFTTDHYFPNFKEAREYVEQLKSVASVLNGFTIRRMQIDGNGDEHCVAVLMHRRYVPLEQCITGKPYAGDKESPKQIAFNKIKEENDYHWPVVYHPR